VLAIAFLLAGCATAQLPQLSRQEWMALKTRTYHNVTSEQAYQAAERLLRLADPDDVKASYDADGRLRMVRTWAMWTGFFWVTQYGADIWLFDARPVADGTRMTVGVTRGGESGAQPITGLDDDPGVYELFWARMDYLLGRSTVWLTCPMYAERARRAWGDPFLLCDPFTIEDRAPEAVAGAPAGR